MYANVSIINVPIALELEYSIPISLEDTISIGHLVVVPLGPRKEFGIITEIYNIRRMDAIVLDIDSLVLIIPPIDKNRILLSREIAKVTGQPTGVFLQKMLPVELGVAIEKQYAIGEYDPDDLAKDLSDFVPSLSKRIDNEGMISRKNLTTGERVTIVRMERKGALTSTYKLVQKISSKRENKKKFQLGLGAEYIAETHGFGRMKASADRRREAFEYIKREAPVVDQWIFASSGCNKEDLKWLLEHGLIIKTSNENRKVQGRLIGGQTSASSATNITGSKVNYQTNSIYIFRHSQGALVIEEYRKEIIRTLEQKKFVWLIYPETFEADTAAEYLATNGGLDPTVFHSGISMSRRAEIWHEIYTGKVQFVIGTLDALFLPAPEPGLIIIDEPQECRSHAEVSMVIIAKVIADAIHHYFMTKNFYSSVLPSVTDHFESKYRIPNLFGDQVAFITNPETIERLNSFIVDMGAELKQGNLSVISSTLKKSIQQSIAAGLPTVLFLNRKGYANYIFCRDCGTAHRCESCGAIIHVRDGQGAIVEACTQCGKSNRIPAICPSCESKNFRPFGAGIKMVEAACRVFAPDARIALWESGGKGSARGEITYARLMNGEIDILIGTQAISKNIPFPEIGTLGFVLAESSFNHPDPFRIESAFRLHLELLSKADKGTTIVLQSYQPHERLWDQLLSGDKDSFIDEQLAARSLIGFPPFGSMIKLTYRHSNIETCIISLEETKRKVIQLVNNEGIENFAIQEFPPDSARIQRLYPCHLILRNFPVDRIDQLALRAGWRVDVSPNSLTE